MRYPRFLQKNGTIGFVAPSFGCATEPYSTCFDAALKKFERLGYHTQLGPNCRVEEGIGISNTPALCGKELTESYCSKDNDILISCGGGEMMCEVIPYMDFERMKQADPKWYLGYSDNTNFTFLSTTILDTAAVYGPCASSFGMQPWHPSLQDTMDVLTGKMRCVSNYDSWELEQIKDETMPLVPYNTTEPFKLVAYSMDVCAFSGRLIGGCLDCLVNLVGTEFDRVRQFNERYKEDGIIWFLEACEMNVMAIRRGLWQLKKAGWFEHVRGFLIGRTGNAPEAFGTDKYRSTIDMLEEFDVPIIMDLDIGHMPPQMPIISGSTAEVTVEGNNILINYTFG